MEGGGEGIYIRKGMTDQLVTDSFSVPVTTDPRIIINSGSPDRLVTEQLIYFRCL